MSWWKVSICLCTLGWYCAWKSLYVELLCNIFPPHSSLPTSSSGHASQSLGKDWILACAGSSMLCGRSNSLELWLVLMHANLHLAVRLLVQLGCAGLDFRMIGSTWKHSVSRVGCHFDSLTIGYMAWDGLDLPLVRAVTGHWG